MALFGERFRGGFTRRGTFGETLMNRLKGIDREHRERIPG